MLICIPTYKREENQKCYERMPDEIKRRVLLATHSDEVENLKKANPEANVVDIGVTDGIADVRQRILNYAKSQNEEKVFIMDDSCTFKKRVKMKLTEMGAQDWEEMIERVSERLDEYPMVGISDQAGNNRVEKPELENQRSYSCYGINVEFFKENGIRFDAMYQEDNDIKFYEDFYVILKLLTSGFKNLVIYEYAFSHAHGKKGGNSVLRSNNTHKKSIDSLKTFFPKFVDVVKKENPSWKAGLNDEENFRWDVKISWKKAFEYGQSKVESVSLF
tara:strand:+ start:96331 stop:97155 length:825 start_codon:yes stop_codon:yes gene_type:complete